jgi:hypothetical protein
LQAALGVGEETAELNLDPIPSLSALRFDHYQVLTQEDGTLFELGRGAMGVTYKAIDINLRCAVALKVIDARFIGDELARRPLCPRGTRSSQCSPSERRLGVSSGDER